MYSLRAQTEAKQEKERVQAEEKNDGMVRFHSDE